MKHLRIFIILSVAACLAFPCSGSEGMESVSSEMNAINEPGISMNAPDIKAETRAPLGEYGNIYELVPPEDRIQFDMLTKDEIFKLKIEMQAAHTKIIIDLGPEEHGNVSLIKEYYDNTGALIAKMVDTRNMQKGNMRKWFDKNGGIVSEVKYSAGSEKASDIMQNITAEDLNDGIPAPASDKEKSE